MKWDNTTLFTIADLEALEGELLKKISFPNRHEVVKHILESHILSRFSHIENPLGKLLNPQIFSQAAIYLNLAIAMRENSLIPGDLFSKKSEYYDLLFRRELDRALESAKFDIKTGVEFIR